jgi:hypothetical protein
MCSELEIEFSGPAAARPLLVQMCQKLRPGHWLGDVECLCPFTHRKLPVLTSGPCPTLRCDGAACLWNCNGGRHSMPVDSELQQNSFLQKRAADRPLQEDMGTGKPRLGPFVTVGGEALALKGPQKLSKK